MDVDDVGLRGSKFASGGVETLGQNAEAFEVETINGSGNEAGMS